MMKTRPRIEAFKVQLPVFELVPSAPNRQWMDDFGDRHPYRCLPLSIANTHGWDILCPADVEISWNGNPGKADLEVRALGELPEGVVLDDFLRSHFTRGVFTFHTTYMFRTPPGWSILVSGTFNQPKHGCSPLTGIVESDWLPYPFTMNWIMTAPGTVRFAKGEPICTIMPIPKNYLGDWDVAVHEMGDDPAMSIEHEAFRAERANFQDRLDAQDPEAIKQAWQRHYFVGRHPDGTMVDDHTNKMRLTAPINAVGMRPVYAKPDPTPPPVFKMNVKLAQPKGNLLTSGSPLSAFARPAAPKAEARPSASPVLWHPDSLMNRIDPEQSYRNRNGRQRLADGMLTDRRGVTDLSKGPGGGLVDFIVLPDFLSADQCAALSHYAKIKDFAKNNDSVDVDYWKSRILFYSDVRDERPDLAAMMKRAHSEAAQAIEHFYRLAVPVHADTVQLVRWNEGMHMEPHADRANPDGSPHAFAHRDFASVIYLNDDYEGGEIFFTAQDMVLRPRAGMLVAFTGGWRHEHAVLKVTKGTRYTMPGFYTFDPERRDRTFYDEATQR